MPNKTIYVRDEDLPIFDRAVELAGDSLSSVIAEAIRRYVEMEEMKSEGFEEVTVLEGVGDNMRKKKFIGKEISYHDPDPFRKGFDGTVYTLYLTKKGSYVVEIFHWDRRDDVPQSSELVIEDSIDELKKYDNIPAVLIEEAAEELGGDAAEFLDI